MDHDFFNQVNLKPFFEDYFEKIPDLFVFAKDKDFRFTMMNEVFLKRLGLEEKELLGKTDFDFFDPGMVELFRIEDREVLGTGRPLLNRTWFLPGKDGGFDWYISSKYPLFDEDKNILGLIGIMRGISQAASILGPYEDFSKVLDYINENYQEQIAIQDLADMMNLSVSQFERNFKKIIGTSPLKYINKVRLDAASHRLIKSDEPISNIALEFGFFDHSYFIKKFKAYTGKTPKEYRKNFLSQ